MCAKGVSPGVSPPGVCNHFLFTVFFSARHDRLSERGNAQGSTGALILVAFENKKYTAFDHFNLKTRLPYNNN